MDKVTTRSTLDDKARRKAEVRARLEASSNNSQRRAHRTKNKGFMTPERKKRLRNLLRKKAAEELKIEQEKKAEERRKSIAQRAGKPKPTDGANEAYLQAICREYHNRCLALSSQKYDMELIVKWRDMEIRDLTEKVASSRGRFEKPILKKVSKTANQLEKIRLFAARAAQADYRASLKQVAKKEYTMDAEDKEKKERERPEWVEGGGLRLDRSSSKPFLNQSVSGGSVKSTASNNNLNVLGSGTKSPDRSRASSAIGQRGDEDEEEDDEVEEIGKAIDGRVSSAASSHRSKSRNSTNQQYEYHASDDIEPEEEEE